ncbi:MAG: methyltransferase domain-containing protein [Anaerolineae bacterium]
MEQRGLENASVTFMNAKHLGFPAGTFDVALCGFMGWYDCFDFVQFAFTQPDTKAKEIRRVLEDGGRFVCCSWEEQEDLAWMEEAILRHYPAILRDDEYLERRPIGMAYEKAEGYEIIMQSAGFQSIEVAKETMTFLSTDEEEWWRQMLHLGWDSLIEKIETGELQRVKEAIFQDLQSYKQADGLHFRKVVFFVSAVK